MGWNLAPAVATSGKMASFAFDTASQTASFGVDMAFKGVGWAGKKAGEVGSRQLKRIEMERSNKYLTDWSKQDYSPVPKRQGLRHPAPRRPGFVENKTANLLSDTKGAIKGIGMSAAIGGAMYGLMAYASDPRDSVDTSDRMYHYATYGIAAGADIASDIALTGVGLAAATTLGAPGVLIGTGLMAFNMVGGFMGLDAGSLAMRIMGAADEEYQRRGEQGIPKFNMTQNTSMAMQRQIQNLHASGSNLGEAMHN